MMTMWLRGWLRSLRRWELALTRIHHRRSVRTTALGFELVLDLRDNVQRSLALTGDYEPQLRQLILGELRKDDVFLDIGAHVGTHSLVVARHLAAVLGGGYVHAFEPVPGTAMRLERAAETAGLRNIFVHRMALSDAVGTLTMRADPWFGRGDSAVVSPFNEGAPIAQVPTLPFDDWMRAQALNRMDVVKLDIEGGEYRALRGMQSSLRQFRPRLVIVEELDGLLKRAGIPPRAITMYLGTLGYVMQCRIERNLVFRPDVVPLSS